MKKASDCRRKFAINDIIIPFPITLESSLAYTSLEAHGKLKRSSSEMKLQQLGESFRLQNKL